MEILHSHLCGMSCADLHMHDEDDPSVLVPDSLVAGGECMF